MRTVTLAVGIVALVLGAGLVALSLYSGLAPTGATAPPGHALTLTPSTIGPLRATVRWTDAGANDTVYVTSAPVSCSSPTGVVARGLGNNGSLSLGMNPGTTYYLFGCTGAGGVVQPHFTYTLLGLTIYLLLGIFLLAAGVFMLLIAVRPAGPAETTPPAMEEPASPPPTPSSPAMPENMRVPPLFDEAPDADTSSAPTSQPPTAP